MWLDEELAAPTDTPFLRNGLAARQSGRALRLAQDAIDAGPADAETLRDLHRAQPLRLQRLHCIGLALRSWRPALLAAFALGLGDTVALAFQHQRAFKLGHAARQPVGLALLRQGWRFPGNGGKRGPGGTEGLSPHPPYAPDSMHTRGRRERGRALLIVGAG